MSNTTGHQHGLAGLDHSLDLLSDTYNYNHWIYSLLRPWLGERVAEVGSGPGNITRFLLDRSHLVCIEPHEAYRQALEHLAEVHRNLSVFAGDDSLLEDPRISGQGIDTVICVNVLEHIENHERALSRFHAVLRDGGRLLLYVPACNWALGEIDRGLGHFRRYGRRQLIRLGEEAGFRIARCRYVNFLGLWGWWWAARVRKEAVIDPRKARVMDRAAPYLSALERIFPPIIGQSLLMVAEKSSVMGP